MNKHEVIEALAWAYVFNLFGELIAFLIITFFKRK